MKSKFVVVLFSAICISTVYAEIEFTTNTIASNLNNPRQVAAADLDGDGDVDIVPIEGNNNMLRWWENDGNQEFAPVEIDSLFSPRSVNIVDLDGDGDMDIVTESIDHDEVYWFCNNGDAEFTRYTVASDMDTLLCCYPADIDGDGDIDIVSGGENDVLWWENDGTPEEDGWTEHIIDSEVDRIRTLCAVDFDGDGDGDVVGGSPTEDIICWWENEGNGDWTQRYVSDNYNGPKMLKLGDVDSDGDMDILAAGETGHPSAEWFENGGGDPINWTVHYLVGSRDNYDMGAADFDQDGDIDVISGSVSTHYIYCFENDGNESFTRTEVDDSYPHGMCTVDLDGDFDEDIVSVSFSRTSLYFHENELNPDLVGEFSLLSPADASVFDASTVTMRWEATECLIPDVEIEYSLYIATDEDFTDPNIIEVGTDTFCTFDGLEAETQYWWKVYASGTENIGAFSEEEWTFSTYSPAPPEEFSLIAPLDESEVNEPNISLTWETAYDPNPVDIITYTLFIDTDENFSEPDELDAGTDTTANYNGLVDSTDYWWKVLAVDSNGDSTWSNETWSFFYRDLSIAPKINLGGIPDEFAISSLYPNPFNSSVIVTVGLPESANLRISVFNILGKEIAQLCDGYQDAGYTQFSFDASGHASGIYFISAEIPGQMHDLRKIVFIQ